MYKRHWSPIYDVRPDKTQPAADTNGVRMVRGTSHEYDP